MPFTYPGDRESLIELRDIRKNFGAIEAIRGVSLTINGGEVVGFVGDNGAGKSTLMKILCGAYRPDRGSILLDGRPVHFESPHDARRDGIEMVYQDLALVGDLDVTGNIFLGREVTMPLPGGFVRVLDRKSMDAACEEVLERLNIAVGSLREKVVNFSGGQRQAIAIARAVTFKPKLIIMDEPTAALSLDKIQRVLDLIRALKGEGIAVVLISHRLQDVLDVADRVLVLRDGKLEADLSPEHATIERLIAAMTGRQNRGALNG